MASLLQIILEERYYTEQKKIERRINQAAKKSNCCLFNTDFLLNILYIIVVISYVNNLDVLSKEYL